MKLQNIRRNANWMIILSSLLFSYNNCSPNTSFVGKNATSSSSTISSALSGGSCTPANTCEDQLMRFYSSGYQQFLVQNCSNCHSAGPGKGQFANANTCLSYNDFMQIGFSTVSKNALSDAHNPPNSGPQHLTAINRLRSTWLTALSEFDICNGGSGDISSSLTLYDRAQYSLGAQVIPAIADNQEARLEFDISQALSIKGAAAPVIPGARFSIMIKKEVKGDNKYYVIHSPRVFGSSVDVQVKGLFTKINGRYIQYSTNFRFADASVPNGISENDDRALISTGAIIIAGIMSPSDQLGFDLELVRDTVIPPPPPPVSMYIDAPDAIMASGGFIDIPVRLAALPTETISFTITADSNNYCSTGTETVAVGVNNSSCLPSVFNALCPSGSCANNILSIKKARSTLQTGNPFNRFDWDYKFETTSMVFIPGEALSIGETLPTKNVRIKLSTDIRFETNRVLRLQIEQGLGNTTLGKSVVNIIFNKQANPQPPLSEMTYSRLMDPFSGVLFRRCNECHNSSDNREGGYDVADHSMMISRGVIVPGADSVGTYVSKILKRINKTFDPNFDLLRAMPRSGQPLDYDTEAIKIEEWVLNGAKNN